MTPTSHVYNEYEKMPYADPRVLFDSDLGLSVYNAKRAPQKIVSFDSLEEAKSKIGELLINLDGAVAAKVANDVMIRIGKGEFICIKNTPSLSAVNKELLHKDVTHKYEISYKVAEFHGWLEIKNPQTGFSAHLGAGPEPVGAWFNGEFHVRYDSHYDKKYFDGHKQIDDSTRFVHHNKGSSEVVFEVDAEALDRARAQVLQEMEDHPTGNTKFNFTKNNCHEFAFRVLNKALGTENVRAVEFENADLVDLADQGISYNFWCAYSPKNYFVNNFDYALFHIQKNLPVNPIASLWHKYQNYSFHSKLVGEMSKPSFNPNTIITDEFGGIKPGSTLLSFAIEAGYFSTAKKLIELGANVDIADIYGLTPLHKIASSTYLSNEKYDLLKLVASKSSNVDTLDYYGEFTPLAKAIISEDLAAMKILIEEYGASYKLVNEVGDNLMHIAADYKVGDHDVINYMYDLAPDLFYSASGNRQLPFYRESIHSQLEDKIPLKEALDRNDAFNKVANMILIEEMFSELKCCDI